MLRIAVAQTPGSRISEWRATRDLIDEMARRAAAENADIVILPECVWPAYMISSPDEYFDARRGGMPSDREFIAHLCDLARNHKIAICAGYIAEPGDRLANAAALIDSSGKLLGVRHKCFLWDFDYELFEPGHNIRPVDTPWGPIGIMICADARLPEIPATLAARGARLILQPTAWVNCGTPERLWNPQPELLIPDRAREFGLPIASASKWGAEGGVTFVGSSIVCDSGGRVLAKCGVSQTELIVAEVELGKSIPASLTETQRERLGSQDTPVAPAPDLSPIHISPSANAGIRLWGTDDQIELNGPTDAPFTIDGARMAAIDARDALSFAPIRTYAIDAIHAAIVFGDGTSERTLRTRAAENRIFVVWVAMSGIRAYNPRGEAVGSLSLDGAPDDSNSLRLEVAQAADKEFAPRTDPFAERRPADYEF